VPRKAGSTEEPGRRGLQIAGLQRIERRLLHIQHKGMKRAKGEKRKWSLCREGYKREQGNLLRSHRKKEGKKRGSKAAMGTGLKHKRTKGDKLGIKKGKTRPKLQARGGKRSKKGGGVGTGKNY